MPTEATTPPCRVVVAPVVLGQHHQPLGRQLLPQPRLALALGVQHRRPLPVQITHHDLPPQPRAPQQLVVRQPLPRVQVLRGRSDVDLVAVRAPQQLLEHPVQHKVLGQHRHGHGDDLVGQHEVPGVGVHDQAARGGVQDLRHHRDALGAPQMMGLLLRRRPRHLQELACQPKLVQLAAGGAGACAEALEVFLGGAELAPPLVGHLLGAHHARGLDVADQHHGHQHLVALAEAVLRQHEDGGEAAEVQLLQVPPAAAVARVVEHRQVLQAGLLEADVVELPHALVHRRVVVQPQLGTRGHKRVRHQQHVVDVAAPAHEEHADDPLHLRVVRHHPVVHDLRRRPRLVRVVVLRQHQQLVSLDEHLVVGRVDHRAVAAPEPHGHGVLEPHQHVAELLPRHVLGPLGLGLAVELVALEAKQSQEHLGEAGLQRALDHEAPNGVMGHHGVDLHGGAAHVDDQVFVGPRVDLHHHVPVQPRVLRMLHLQRLERQHRLQAEGVHVVVVGRGHDDGLGLVSRDLEQV
mmetsp:Transcript_19679/g.49338  ORF Transcript_19679/g.49338 Transcript_19679/m.49338 type:complete len:520 (+) Transcript_19679:94-1653(+)